MRRVAGRFAIVAVGAASFATVGANLALALPSDLTAPVITREVTGAAGEAGWFSGPVNVRWTVFDPESPWTTSGCDARTLSEESEGVTVECRASSAGGSSANGMVVKIDSTPPTVSDAAPDRGPDRSRWYRSPVTIAFSGSDPLSGIAACTAVTYAGPDARRGPVSGSCRDQAGNESGPLTFELSYDATGPQILGARAARPPDHGHWYQRPVKIRFRARDQLSGDARCAPVIYRGPDGHGNVQGTCSDHAGNITTRKFPLRFDATAPTVKLSAKPGGHLAALRWRAARDARFFRLSRWIRGQPWTRKVVYRGAGYRHLDEGLSNGQRYQYEVLATDRAGNHGRHRTSVKPHRGLLAPTADAQITAPPLLRWTPELGARFYNVQLVRDRRTILSDWSQTPRYQLRATWTFKQQTQSLVPGRYSWYVWAAKRRQSGGVRGQRIGQRHFEVLPDG